MLKNDSKPQNLSLPWLYIITFEVYSLKNDTHLSAYIFKARSSEPLIRGNVPQRLLLDAKFIITSPVSLNVDENIFFDLQPAYS